MQIKLDDKSLRVLQDMVQGLLYLKDSINNLKNAVLKYEDITMKRIRESGKENNGK